MNEVVRRQYPVDVESLYSVLTSRDFFECRHAWSRIDEYRFERFGQYGDAFVVRLVQPLSLQIEKLPVLVRRFLPAQADLITEFRWRPCEGGYQAEFRLRLGGVPASVSGTMTLRAAGVRTASQEVRACVRSSLPLPGKKLEQRMVARFDRLLESDYRHTLRYLRQRCEPSALS